MESIKIESKTYQYRKVTKPLLERKRRARINKCLDELKDLMVDCMRHQQQQPQGDNIARLEKADILELTVEHLRNIKTNKSKNYNTKNTESFRSGYVHAANEVSRALATLPRVDIDLGTKLMTHLGHRLNEIEQKPSPLTVYCGNHHHHHHHDNNNYSSRTLMSPSASSGYGSDDNESINSQSSSSSTISQRHENGLLQVANDNQQNVWRPW